MMKEFGPLYQQGMVTLDVDPQHLKMDLTDALFGIQVSADGRVWVCVNGMSWLRFKPHRTATVSPPTEQLEEV